MFPLPIQVNKLFSVQFPPQTHENQKKANQTTEVSCQISTKNSIENPIPIERFEMTR